MTTNWFSPADGLLVYATKGADLPTRFGTTWNFKGFDMDDTLIKTRSGKRFPENADDWTWNSPKVPEMLRGLTCDPCNHIFIVSNQSRFCHSIAQKIKALCAELNIPILFIVCSAHNKYRKPMRGVMDYLENLYGKPDYTNSFYVGNAMLPGVDHANSDYYFALNCRVPFIYSYVYFDISMSKKRADEYAAHMRDGSGAPSLTTLYDFKGTNSQTIDAFMAILNKPADKIISSRSGGLITKVRSAYNAIILVGAPASGKSTLATALSERYGYTIVSRDDFPTKNGYTKFFRSLVNSGKKIVVDNTHATEAQRDEALTLLDTKREIYYEQTAMVIVSDRKCAHYLNLKRTYETGKYIPDVVYNVFYKKFEMPYACDFYDVLTYSPSYNISDSDYIY